MTVQEEISESSKIAADWWVDKIDISSLEKLSEAEANDDFIMELLKKYRIYNMKKNIERFRLFLYEYLKEELWDTYNVSLYSGYGPTGVLLDFAIEADLVPVSHEEWEDSFLFPFKTSMLVSKDEIMVSEGFMSEPQIIFDRSKKVKTLRK